VILISYWQGWIRCERTTKQRRVYSNTSGISRISLRADVHPHRAYQLAAQSALRAASWLLCRAWIGCQSHTRARARAHTRRQATHCNALVSECPARRTGDLGPERRPWCHPRRDPDGMTLAMACSVGGWRTPSDSSAKSARQFAQFTVETINTS
jgi:hypothetical protein